MGLMFLELSEFQRFQLRLEEKARKFGKKFVHLKRENWVFRKTMDNLQEIVQSVDEKKVKKRWEDFFSLPTFQLKLETDKD